MLKINLFNNLYNGEELTFYDQYLDYYIEEIDCYIRIVGDFELNIDSKKESIWFLFKGFGNLGEVDFDDLPKDYEVVKETYDMNTLTFILLNKDELNYLNKQIN